MAERTHQLEIVNRLPELDRATQWLQEHLEAAGASPQALYVASLALEELFTNIVKYGYEDPETPHTVLVELRITPERFCLRLSDDGRPFNPFGQAGPDTSLPLAEREAGGLGIHLVQRMLENCVHRHESGRNIVSVERSLHCTEITTGEPGGQDGPA